MPPYLPLTNPAGWPRPTFDWRGTDPKGPDLTREHILNGLGVPAPLAREDYLFGNQGPMPAPMPSYMSPDRAATDLEAAFGLKTGGGAAAMPGMSQPPVNLPPWMKELSPPSASSDAMQPAGDSAARRAGYTRLDPKLDTPGMPWLLGLGGAPPEISPEVEARAKQIDSEVRARNPVIGYDQFDPKGARGYSTLSPNMADIPTGPDRVTRAVRGSAMPTAWDKEPAWYAAEKARQEAGRPQPLSGDEQARLAQLRTQIGEQPKVMDRSTAAGSEITPEMAQGMSARELFAATTGKRLSEQNAARRADPAYQMRVEAGRLADRDPNAEPIRVAATNRYKEDPQVAEIRRQKLKQDFRDHNAWREERREAAGWKSKDKRMALADAQTDFRNVMQGRQGDAAISEPYWVKQQREHQARMKAQQYEHEDSQAALGREHDLKKIEIEGQNKFKGDAIGEYIKMESARIAADPNMTPGEKSEAMGRITSLLQNEGGLKIDLPSAPGLGGVQLPSAPAVSLPGASGGLPPMPSESPSASSDPMSQPTPPQPPVRPELRGQRARDLVQKGIADLRASGKPVTNAALMQILPLEHVQALVDSGGRSELHQAMISATGDPNIQAALRGWVGPQSGMSGYYRTYVGEEPSWGNGGYITDWMYPTNAVGQQAPAPAPQPPRGRTSLDDPSLRNVPFGG